MERSASSSILKAHSRGSFSRLVFESEPNNGGGHKDRSLCYRFWQFVVLVFRVITPCSYIFLVSIPALNISPSQFGGNVPFVLLTVWMIVEALFFPYYYYLFVKLNQSEAKLTHFASNKKTRMRLVRNCFQALRLAGSPSNPEEHVRKALEGWFLDVPLIKIKRGNMESWCGWAFFGEDLEKLTPDERKQNNEIVNYIQNQAKWTFPAGFQEDLPSARLTLDPVFATQRPFLVYATIGITNIITHLILWSFGYRKRVDAKILGQIIYHRKGSGYPANLEIPNGTKPTPIIFVHGIGIGFAHYLAFILQLPKELDVYLLEWPHVAMQMASTAPSPDDSVGAIMTVLDTDGHDKACIVAHSLGCTVASWLLHHPVACRRVSATVLIDPVTFLLCDPTVATKVVYKDPVNTLDFLMHFFVARELFIANALSRHFNWSHNIIFVEDLSAVDSKDFHAYSPFLNANNPSKGVECDGSDSGGSVDSFDTPVQQLQIRHTILLSENDSIVPVQAVMRYLHAKTKQGHSCFEVLTFKGTHGEVFLYPKWISVLVNKCRMQCGLPATKTTKLTKSG